MDNNGRAVIEDGAIVIRVLVNSLQDVIEGTWATGNLDVRYKLTNPEDFAKDLVLELNDEDEEGTTPIHRLFDKAMSRAIDQGAFGVEEHEDQNI